MKLSLYYEAQPFRISQPHGVVSYDANGKNFYARFGFLEHNGIDIAHGHNSRLRAPFPWQFHAKLWQPNGGGLVLTIVSKSKYDGPDGKPAHVMLDLMHLSKVLKESGEGDTGDLIAIAGNTGVSTGPHTHLKYTWVRRVGAKWIDVEKNDADNTFNQLPFYSGLFAVNYRPPAAKPQEPPIAAAMESEAPSAVSAANASLESLEAVLEASPDASQSFILDLIRKMFDILIRALAKK